LTIQNGEGFVGNSLPNFWGRPYLQNVHNVR
jgi:hypothetical protein